jgi:hypothetical protein
MVSEDLDGMYEETYQKNDEIQALLVEVKDYDEILAFLYDTGIQRPNLTLNSIIDTYESLILKIRELHQDIINSLDEFGQESDLADVIIQNDQLTEKVKELMLWKLRRIFMVYDKEPVMPYIEGPLVGIQLTESDNDGETGDSPAEENATDEPASAERKEAEQISPEGGVFAKTDEKTPVGNPS